MSTKAPTETLPSAAQAGRGGIALSMGKLFFLAAGLVQQVVLKAILGLAGYGALSTTLSIASIAYNPLVQAGIQGLSRETAGLPDQTRPYVVRQLLKVHLFGSAGLALLFFFLAPLLASALGAPHIAPAVRVLSGVLFLYGLYAPLVGILNGKKRFMTQAALDAFAAALRTVGLLGGAYLGTRWLTRQQPEGAATDTTGVFFTCLGFLGAACVVLLVAAAQTGIGRRGATPSDLIKRYTRVLQPLWAGQILLNLLFQADALLLRKFAADAARHAQLAEAVADPLVGAYRATQLFCFLPFQLLTSVTFVLFPLLASARARGDSLQIAQLIARGMRLSLIATGMLVCVLLARTEGLLALVFGQETSLIAAPAMRILAVGMGAFALLGVMTSALNGLGRERVSLGLIFVATLLVGALCVALVRGVSLDATMLERTATATSIAMLVTTLFAAGALKKLLGASLELRSGLRTIASTGIAAFCVAQLLPPGHLWTILSAPLCGLVYLVVQVLSGELKKDDLARVRSLIQR